MLVIGQPILYKHQVCFPMLTLCEIIIWMISILQIQRAECNEPNHIHKHVKMTSWNRNALNFVLVNNPLWVESSGHRGFPSQRASNVDLWCFFYVGPKNCWTNTRVAGDLLRHDVHVIYKKHVAAKTLQRSAFIAIIDVIRFTFLCNPVT